MPKIFIFTNTFPPEFGAAPTRLFDMAKGLKNGGFDVEVLTGMPNYPTNKITKKYRGKGFSKEVLDQLPVRRHWMYANHSNQKLPRLWNMLSLAITTFWSLRYVIRQRPKYIIAQFPPMAMPFTAWLFAKITGAKLIVNVSDIWPSAMLDLAVIRKGGAYRLLDSLETFLYQNSNFILAQSNEIVSHIKNKSSVPTLLYRTGVDCSIFQPSPNKSHSEKLRIAYFGVLGVAHNLLEISKQIDFSDLNAELHIYGDGHETIALAKFLEKNPHRNIQLYSPIPYAKVPKTLASYDAALIAQKTRVYGTVPSKMYEAMACGLPILFHGAGEGAEIVEKAGCGLISNPHSMGELKNNIQKLESISHNSQMEIGAKGRAIATQYFDRKFQIEKLVKRLKELESVIS